MPPPSAYITSLAAPIQRALLRWFVRHRRALPWRRNRDPYRIWVSEVMLQQTQVATVIPYFERFVKRFPTVCQLAAADEQEVFRIWEGLGYYRRARNLHQAARTIMANHNGLIPRDPHLLGSLPGIGRYSMGAILSQAFDHRLPILEGNSMRVLCRLFGKTGDPRRGPIRRWLWQAAEALLPQHRAGEFNQAIMELGALVCTPVSPCCTSCPLRRQCQAARLGIVELIPAKAAKVKTTQVNELAVVIRRQKRVLLVRRPPSGRWAGLWEFPHLQVGPGPSQAEVAPGLIRALTGLDILLERELATLRHSVTRHRITLTCWLARHRAGRFQSSFYTSSAWVRPELLANYPVSAPQRRLVESYVRAEQQLRFR